MNSELLKLQDTFNQKCQNIGIDSSKEESERLLNYLSLLLKWNKAFNLTAITNPKEALDLHLLDSVAVSPAIKDYSSLLDVGTGGGLPGIPLAILNPEKQFTLLDTNSKKTRFLKQVVYELGLNNVTVINQRVQDFENQSGYACILSRAFASLSDMVQWTGHLLTEHGHWLAMKGQYPQQELDELPETAELVKANEVKLPGVNASRWFIYLKQKQ
ncbi:16S rRNA (guanine(527)-N(7))-methyltransferase RsmG [Kangiella koreensis]|uniref:Ribosomal RNA small subunit methyltransferase G n=1 Tax=Kangiella koreensis (strain DSM 16069 / JCM 12317 / KCTC 12182 / SW-125) TaxID=523791 RepID=C7RAF2_KANKD|nr:16S rRNA (guanine(527)-N(7))-methyltransferase RsmG [Kangiella koreensis]ACV28046.1 methyltransferase GidB [Kangiella koreensis DSM 16069]